MIKTCSKCGQEKLYDAFHPRIRSKDGLQAWCRSCHLAAQQKWRKEKPEKAKALQSRCYQRGGKERAAQWRAKRPELNKANRDRQRNAKRQHVSNYKKAKGCEYCRIHDPRVLDLHHHNREDKVLAVSQPLNRRSWDALKEELSKCRVLCSNCHRIRHYEHARENQPR